MTKRVRIDRLLVERGLFESRAKAQEAIAAGMVSADGTAITKPAAEVSTDATLQAAPAHPWVSRGGVKLAAALDHFGIDPNGRICLDVGASTGGFTQVLLARGAARVYAVDVGHGQLHPSLRDDPRVVSLERTDARTLTRSLIAEAPSLVVCDASFIGAGKVLAAPLSLAAESADLVALIKPQFEAGPGKGGVLADDVANLVAATAINALDGQGGFRLVDKTDSPIRGGDGNLEILVHMRR
jgi:23S rRNA (cytidine1920-2'-O)/16S rRNA (cytidine1409-2'-O)-methyltransferase